MQAGVVLKHLRKYRPDWCIDIKVGYGKHSALVGLCNRVYTDKDVLPLDTYSTKVMVAFFENHAGYPDRPNSKVTNCLRDVFGLEYDPSLGRYECPRGQEKMDRTADYLRSIGCTANGNGTFNAVVIHYEGNTSAHKKNLSHWQAAAFCDTVIRAGRVPVILDWDGRSSLYDQKRIFCPIVSEDDIWGGFGSGDAETIACLIQQAEAFIGIDSGPGKISSSTDTPAIHCWKGHHPIQFHDPAPNTTHLVPVTHTRLEPCRDRPEIVQYFKEHYIHRTYTGEHGLVYEVQKWLGEVLGCETAIPSVQFVLPGGIGDCVWALHKIKSVAAGRPIDIIVSGNANSEIDRRALPFLKRFGFIRSATVLDISVLIDHDSPADALGRYRYVPDGLQGNHHFLIPNAPLEAGKRLETWLPQHPIDWSIMDEFSWENTERGTEAGKELKPFAVFYLGPETGNTVEGHNRGTIWTPGQWVELGKKLMDKGLKIAIVGANYDRSYWEKFVRPEVERTGMKWYDFIGAFEIGETFGLMREAKMIIGYQCGLIIVGHYLGMNTATWWRRNGDSIHPHRKIGFSEEMRNAWMNPAYADRYLGMVYGREQVDDLLYEIDVRKWLK